MPLALIFSLDYELFGDGSGSVDREQITPTNALMDVFDQHGAKLSIFLEHGQYAGYERFASTSNSFAEDNEKIRRQLVDAIRRGHDAQLHYHPAWQNANYADERFELDLDTYDISLLSEDVIEDILTAGKRFLEELLQPEREDYVCNSFRAGAWSIQDPKRFLPIFRRLGFLTDSSVVPEVKLRSIYGGFDYRGVPHRFRPWPIGDSLSDSDSNGACHEIPIYTLRHPLAFLKYRNAKYLKNMGIVSRRYKTKVCERQMGIFGKVRKVLTRNYYMADFNTMTTETLTNMIARASKEVGDTDERVPIMLIGHSKSSHSPEHFHDLFRNLSHIEGVEYWALGQFTQSQFGGKSCAS